MILDESGKAHLNTRPRRAIQEGLDEVVKPPLRPIRQGDKVIMMVDEIVVPEVKRLFGIDPIEHAQVVVGRCRRKSSQVAVIQQEVIYPQKEQTIVSFHCS
jgi:hypothetical protein